MNGASNKLTKEEMAAKLGISVEQFDQEIQDAGKREPTPIPMNRATRRAMKRAMRRKAR